MNVSRLLNSLHRATYASSGWQLFLEDLVQESNSQSGVLTILDPATLDVRSDINVGMDQQSLKEWNEHFINVDPWVIELQNLPDNQIYVGDDIVAHRQLVDSEMYQEWARKIKIEHASGGVVGLDSDELNLLVTIQQNKLQGATDEETIAQINSLIPHIQSVLSFSLELNTEKKESLAMIEMMEQAAIVCDQNLRVIKLNGQADFLLSSGRVVKLTHGRMAVADAGAHAKLVDVINELSIGVSASKGTILVWQNGLPYIMKVAPLLLGDDGFLETGMRFLVLVREANKIAFVDSSMVAEIYGLTVKETQVATRLAEGMSAKQIASEMVVKESTVRSHIKSLLWKTETRSQQTMIALLHSITPRLL